MNLWPRSSVCAWGFSTPIGNRANASLTGPSIGIPLLPILPHFEYARIPSRLIRHHLETNSRIALTASRENLEKMHAPHWTSISATAVIALVLGTFVVARDPSPTPDVIPAPVPTNTSTPEPIATPTPSHRRPVLIALYNAADGPNWFRNENWLGDLHVYFG